MLSTAMKFPAVNVEFSGYSQDSGIFLLGYNDPEWQAESTNSWA